MRSHFLPRPFVPCLAVALVTALASVGPAAAQNSANPRCPFLFTVYETTARSFGPSPRGDFSAPPPVMNAARQLRMAGCLTFSDQLAAMETLGPGAGAAAITNSGPAITPTWLHAGIVTSTGDDTRARAFFEAKGLRARSVGAAYLGRRIYFGPFTSAGALEAGKGLARSAGFAYPYPANL